MYISGSESLKKILTLLCFFLFIIPVGAVPYQVWDNSTVTPPWTISVNTTKTAADLDAFLTTDKTECLIRDSKFGLPAGIYYNPTLVRNATRAGFQCEEWAILFVGNQPRIRVVAAFQTCDKGQIIVDDTGVKGRELAVDKFVTQCTPGTKYTTIDKQGNVTELGIVQEISSAGEMRKSWEV
jgi:hypothetical protein